MAWLIWLAVQVAILAVQVILRPGLLVEAGLVAAAWLCVVMLALGERGASTVENTPLARWRDSYVQGRITLEQFEYHLERMLRRRRP
jgi:membrane protein implicated in regulation of membrane protease activity